ncbi:Vanin-like protein 1 [Frankliniella fusca]|uniref:Vanin-like protein 1 n=1 Tax=Frankliniella fusca TaxID=407009 RepID=A0AAE1LTG9_9NEOP|nr:Vanin-like protein 1 [Frankliniella fusca]
MRPNQSCGRAVLIWPSTRPYPRAGALPSRSAVAYLKAVIRAMAPPLLHLGALPLATLAALLALSGAPAPARASTPADTHYVAAVVDFAAPASTGKPALENMMDNIASVGRLMEQAATQNADIIVFAEDGLSGFGNKDVPVVVPAPEDNSTPCEDSAADQVRSDQPLRELSCLAKKHNMYLVVNVVDKQPCAAAGDDKCPSRGYHRYNTDVVFDRSGTVVAKYHKYNLFGEASNDVPPTVEYVTFDTDFGVRFGMFICFDILFDAPSAQLVRQRNVTDIIFSAAWFSEVPFLTAVQAHSGWAHALDATVLASGMNNPARGSTGSGIYRGRQGILRYTMNWRNEHTLLVSRVPKHGHWEEDDVVPEPKPERIDPVRNYVLSDEDPYSDAMQLTMIQDHLGDYNSLLIARPSRDNDTLQSGAVCIDTFCCNYDVRAREVTLRETTTAASSTSTWTSTTQQTSAAASLHGNYRGWRGYAQPRDPPLFDRQEAQQNFDGFRYRVVAFNGVRSFSGVATGGAQVCAVVACLSEDILSCGWITPGLDAPGIKWTEFVHIRLSAVYESSGTLQLASTLVGPWYDPLPANVFTLRSAPSQDNDSTQRVGLFSRMPLVDLRTFAIYGRKFSWDGLPPTNYPPKS